MSTGRFAVAVAGIVAMFLIGVGAVVGLELAHRPVSTVVELIALIAAPTALGLLNYATNRQIRYDLHNGVQEQIAIKAAAAVKRDVLGTRTDAELGGRRVGDE